MPILTQTLTKQEEKGRKLFNKQGKCALCHLPDPTLAPDGVSQIPPLFTDFTYDNLGVPQNVNIPGQPIVAYLNDPSVGLQTVITCGNRLNSSDQSMLRPMYIPPLEEWSTHDRMDVQPAKE